MMKPGPLWCLGAMSGTSLDGVDAAMILTDGNSILEFGPHAYRPYSDAEQVTIRAALGQWQGDTDVLAAAKVVEDAHAEVLSRFSGVDLVGFHGQTLAHDPSRARTHQTGNGALLAQRLGLPVIWDFRSNDVAMGGEGAPLAPFYHFACARWMGADMPVAFLNLGGVGNLTWLDPRKPFPDSPGACLAFDTGPANAPVNDLMAERTGRPQDTGGDLAALGTPDEAVINKFLAHPYFQKRPPKSLDRDDFQYLLVAVAHLSDADAAATLTHAAAAAVARGVKQFPAVVNRLLVTGGGRHNAVMMTAIAQRTYLPADPVEAVGLDGDMLEAQAFAFLAARVSMGLPISAPGTTGVLSPVRGGRISTP